MDVGHGDSGAYDPGEVGDVRHLLHRLIAFEIAYQPVVGEDQSVGAHAAVTRHAPPISVDPLELHRLRHRTR